MDVRIAPLADHPEVIPRLRAWFEAEWPGWYGPGGPGNAAEDLRAYAGRDALPRGLYAGTATSATLLERGGWRQRELVDVHGEPVAIYEKVLRSE